jgi:hypothetical protein
MFNKDTRYYIGPRTCELVGSTNTKIIEFIREHGGSFIVTEINAAGSPIKFVMADGTYVETSNMDDVEGWCASDSFIFWADEDQFFTQALLTSFATPAMYREVLYNPISLHSVTIHEVLNNEQDRLNLISKLQRLIIK